METSAKDEVEGRKIKVEAIFSKYSLEIEDGEAVAPLFFSEIAGAIAHTVRLIAEPVHEPQ